MKFLKFKKSNVVSVINFTSSNNEEIKLAIMHSALALIIALYAYLDLFIAVFWLIMLIVYVFKFNVLE